MNRHIFLVAVEPSGDALGADVIDALRKKDPCVRLSGVGGEKMSERGVASSIDVSDLAILGFVDGLKAFGRVKRKVAETADVIGAADPDAVVLIDSWGFMWRLARALKERDARARRIKLVGPQVWASRPGRARVLAAWCEHLLCILPNEPPYYAPYGLPVTVIGNPALGRTEHGDGAVFRAAHGLSPTDVVIGLLPGSRPSEIRRVAPTLIEACERLCRGRTGRRVLCMVAPSVADELRTLAQAWTFPHVLLADESEKSNAFAAIDVALACSGTVTTELALQGAVLVVGYKLGWLTWAIARAFVYRSRFMTLLNVAAEEEIAPEFLQTRFTSARIAASVERILGDPGLMERQRQRQAAALKKMAGPGRPAAVIAAETILRVAAEPRA